VNRDDRVGLHPLFRVRDQSKNCQMRDECGRGHGCELVEDLRSRLNFRGKHAHPSLTPQELVEQFHGSWRRGQIHVTDEVPEWCFHCAMARRLRTPWSSQIRVCREKSQRIPSDGSRIKSRRDLPSVCRSARYTLLSTSAAEKTQQAFCRPRPLVREYALAYVRARGIDPKSSFGDFAAPPCRTHWTPVIVGQQSSLRSRQANLPPMNPRSPIVVVVVLVVVSDTP
jgi:hypothetical protein